MALLMISEGLDPSGNFDNLDGYAPKGGEVYVLYSKGVGTDGYQTIGARPAVAGDGYAFYLVDDGLAGYGVLFGNTVTRTATGFTSSADTATRLGPATNAASGKLTLWGKPGLYGVTLDALFDSETNLRAALPGASLSVDSAGGLGKLKLANMASGSPLAQVIVYKIDEALVTTGGSVVSHKKLIVRFHGGGGII